MTTIPRKKGRPSKLNKLNDMGNTLNNEDGKRKVDNLIRRLASGNGCNETKRNTKTTNEKNLRTKSR